MQGTVWPGPISRIFSPGVENGLAMTKRNRKDLDDDALLDVSWACRVREQIKASTEN